MKLAQERHGSSLTITLRGVVEGASCSCLEHFWQAYIDPETLAEEGIRELVLAMEEVEEIDAAAIATLISLLRPVAAREIAIVFDAAPQVLAHTLYKTAMLENPKRLRLSNEILEEPYAG